MKAESRSTQTASPYSSMAPILPAKYCRHCSNRMCTPTVWCCPSIPRQPGAEPIAEMPGQLTAKPIVAAGRSIEIAYAPRAQQVQCAHLLRQHGIEFILVACWPYLIDEPAARKRNQGRVNLHPSLLPAYRGPDPIGAQLNSAEPHPGVSLHLLNASSTRGILSPRPNSNRASRDTIEPVSNVAAQGSAASFLSTR